MKLIQKHPQSCYSSQSLLDMIPKFESKNSHYNSSKLNKTENSPSVLTKPLLKSSKIPQNKEYLDLKGQFSFDLDDLLFSNSQNKIDSVLKTAIGSPRNKMILSKQLAHEASESLMSFKNIESSPIFSNFKSFQSFKKSKRSNPLRNIHDSLSPTFSLGELTFAPN